MNEPGGALLKGPDDASQELYQQSVRKLESYFFQPPKLDFERMSLNKVTYQLPAIRSREFNQGTSLSSELSRFVEAATEKFFFQDFRNRRTWLDLSWPNEHLADTGGHYSVEKQDPARTKDEVSEYVNIGPEAASAWFRSDIIDDIAGARQPTCTFLLGMPGSGKSTLVKYLVHAERCHASANGVILSRFEASKFFRAYSPTDADTPQSYLQMMEHISDFYFFIVLRDLLLYHAYDVQENGTLRQKTSSLLFGSRSAIDDLVQRAAQAADVTDQVASHSFYILAEAIGPTSFDQKSLAHIPFAMRRELVAILGVGLKICVIFDGLDFLSPEDHILDRYKFKVLEFILVMSGYGLGGLTASFNPRVDHHSMIMLRPNTYERLKDSLDREIETSKLKAYKIAPLSPHVVLFRGILRGLRVVGAYGGNEQESYEAAERLYRALEALLYGVALKMRLSSVPDGLLTIFNGNLRDCFRFISRVLTWVRNESGSAFFPPRSRVADLLEFLSASEAKGFLRQKSYRLIELLLVFQSATFKNLIYVDVNEATISSPKLRKAIPRTELKKSSASTALVDNVFNYHCMDHDNRNDAHNLLLKVRILQVCARAGALTKQAIRDELYDLGYNLNCIADFDKSLVILRYVGFLHRYDDEKTQLYSLTPRGEIVVNHLLFESGYIEHIYHQTLLPEVLLPAKVDAARADGHERWAIASIRNYFAFLCYVHFVESNCPNGKRVPDALKIWTRMCERVVEAVQRIVLQDYVERRNRTPSAWAVNIALAEVEELVSRWKNEGLYEPGAVQID